MRYWIRIELNGVNWSKYTLHRAAQLFAKPPVIAGRKNSAGLLHTPTQMGHTQGLSLGGKSNYYFIIINIIVK